MYNGNPNARPPALRGFRQSPVNYGYPNPAHFGPERIAGQLGVQPNTGGTPTNSLAAGAPISYQDNSWRNVAGASPFGTQYSSDQINSLAAAQRPAGVRWHGYQATPAPSAPPAATPPPAQQTQPAQGASAVSYGYQPLQYTGGNDGAAQDAFIQQQAAAFQTWLKSPQGQQWALQNKNPNGQSLFGMDTSALYNTAYGITPPTPAPKVAAYTASGGWGMYNDPRIANPAHRGDGRQTYLPPTSGTGGVF